MSVNVRYTFVRGQNQEEHTVTKVNLREDSKQKQKKVNYSLMKPIGPIKLALV